MSSSTFVWLSCSVKVSTLLLVAAAAANAVISSILDLRGLGATGGGGELLLPLLGLSFTLGAGCPWLPPLTSCFPAGFPPTFGLPAATFALAVATGFLRLADRLTAAEPALPEATAAESATADGLARSEAARLTLAAAAGRSGSLSAGFRGRCVWWPLIPGAAVDLRLTSESVDEFLWRGDGDLSSSGLRLSELLWRPCLASGDGLREE